MSDPQTAVADKLEKTASPFYPGGERQLGFGILLTESREVLTPRDVSLSVRCTGPAASLELGLGFEYKGTEAVEGVLVLPFREDWGIMALVLEHNDETFQADIYQVGDPELSPQPSTRKDFVGEWLGKTTHFPLIIDLKKVEPGAHIQIGLQLFVPVSFRDNVFRLEMPLLVEGYCLTEAYQSLAVDIQVETQGLLMDSLRSSFGKEVASSEELEVARLTLNEKELADLDSLWVEYRLGWYERPALWLRSYHETFLFSLFPPKHLLDAPQRRDMIFLLDGSENVSPENYQLLSKSLCRVLDSLSGEDRFAVVTFGREVQGFHGGEFQPLGEVEEAKSWLSKQKPYGRADIFPLLERVSNLPYKPERQLCVFLVSAGIVGNEPAIFQRLEFDSRLYSAYCLGVGPKVNQAFVRELARRTGGDHCFVDFDGVDEGFDELLKGSRALLMDITLELPSGMLASEVKQSPSVIGCLSAKNPVNALGCGKLDSLTYRSMDETGVVFSGTIENEPSENPALGTYWAYLRLKELRDGTTLSAGVKRGLLQKEVIELSKKHGFVSSMTGLMLVSGDECYLQPHPDSFRISEVYLGEMGQDSAESTEAKEKERAFSSGNHGSKDAFSSGSRQGLRMKGAFTSGNYGLTQKARYGGGKPTLSRVANRGGDGDASPAPPPMTGSSQVPGEGASRSMVSVEIVSDRPPRQELLESLYDRDRLHRLVRAHETRRARLVVSSLAWVCQPSDFEKEGEVQLDSIYEVCDALQEMGRFREAVRLLEGLLGEIEETEELQELLIDVIKRWANFLADECYWADAVYLYQNLLELDPHNEAFLAERDRLRGQWQSQSFEVPPSLMEIPAVSESQLELPALESTSVSGVVRAVEGVSSVASTEAKPASGEAVGVEEAKPVASEPAQAEVAEVVAKPAVTDPAPDVMTQAEVAKPAVAEPAPSEPAQAEVAKPAPSEPAQAEMAKSAVAEPASSEPAQAEVAKSAVAEPTPSEPAQAEVAKSAVAEPAPSEPAQAEVAKSAVAEPTPSEPAQADVAKLAVAEPVPSEPAQAEVAKPAVAEPASSEPAQAEVAKPAVSGPTPGESARAGVAKPAVAKSAPSEPAQAEVAKPAVSGPTPGEPSQAEVAKPAVAEPAPSEPARTEVSKPAFAEPAPSESVQAQVSKPVVAKSSLKMPSTPKEMEAMIQRYTKDILDDPSDRRLFEEVERLLERSPRRQVLFFQNLIEKHPQHQALFYLYLGKSYQRLDKWAAAIINLQKYLRLQPADGKVYLLMSEAYGHLGRTSLAQAALRKGEKLMQIKGDSSD